jgi:hypothetical protein
MRSALLFAIYRAYAFDPITATTVGGSLLAKGLVQTLPIQRLEVSLREQAPSHSRTRLSTDCDPRCFFTIYRAYAFDPITTKTVGGSLLAKGP